MNDFVRRYRAGQSCTNIARVHQISPDIVRARLRERGITDLRRGPAYITSTKRRRTDIAVDSLLADYDAGASVLALSRKYRLARSGVVRRIEESGRKVRSRSEANRLRMQALSFPERAELAKAANSARRKLGGGQSVTYREPKYIGAGDRRIAAEKASRTRYQTRSTAWETEDVVIDALLSRGLEVDLQVPVGTYNVDIAVGAVAVEVHTSPGNPVRHSRLVRRSVNLIEAGWSICYVWITKAHPFIEAGADELVAHLEVLRLNPSSLGEQRVVRGSGDLASVHRADLMQRTLVPATIDS